ncbi:MAG: N-acetylmuramoyl-L-alanine amidase [Bacteroidales bacterium]|nr:N-acetylmuramoyl-L-alanine amidase [Bacteroidales bacterium]
MKLRIIAFFLAYLMLLPTQAMAKETFTVIIDAGHGGGDAGTPHRKGKLDEKTVALNVALKLGKQIKENHKDVKVVYTRTKDTYPSLPERAQIGRKAKGDLFISIHVNAAENNKARGFETYVFGITGLAGKSKSEQERIRQRTMIERENLDINGKQVDFETTVDLQTKILCQTQREKHNKYSREVAELAQRELIKALRKSSYRNNVNDRGVKEKNIYVLCYSPMPAILIELGYMSNQLEERFINTTEAQDLFASSLYKAFASYKSNWEKRQLDYQGDTDVQKPDTFKKPEEPAQKEPLKKKAVKKEPEQIKELPAKKEPEQVKEPAKQPVVDNRPYYRIQFLVLPKQLKKGAPELKGLWPVDCYKEGNMYKYTVGNSTDRASLQAQMREVKQKFPDAFWVKFDAEGNRIK